MGGALVWVLLLLLLQSPGSRASSCSPVSPPVNWNMEFEGTCLNFSGLGLGLNLTLTQNQSLQARSVQTLDLSNNSLRELPPGFFAHLSNLQLLDLTGNKLRRVDPALAASCGLDLRADCSCELEAWRKVRQVNCSGQAALQCLLRDTGAWQNLSAFLEPNCAPGLSPMAIGAMAAGGVLFLGLAVAGPLLVWRLRGSRRARSQGQGKAWGAQDGSRPSSGSQPRYSSRGLSTKPPVAALHRASVPDYENIFVDQPADEHQWAGHGALPAEDGDFYMNFRDAQQDPQPVYCNLESLRAEETAVVPRR